jgi:hypothetical protein
MSGAFRLPLVLMGGGRMEELGQGKKSGMSASSGRRVVTFLPPPPVVVKPVLRSTAGMWKRRAGLRLG